MGWSVITEWYELEGRNFDEFMTLLNHIPVAVGYNWWFGKLETTEHDPDNSVPDAIYQRIQAT